MCSSGGETTVGTGDDDELTHRINATCDVAPRYDLTAVAHTDLIDTGAWEW